MGERAIRAAQILDGTADWLERCIAFGDLDYATLASGPLGEALTRAEIEPLVNKPDEIRGLIAGIRLSAQAAAQMEA